VSGFQTPIVQKKKKQKKTSVYVCHFVVVRVKFYGGKAREKIE